MRWSLNLLVLSLLLTSGLTVGSSPENELALPEPIPTGTSAVDLVRPWLGDEFAEALIDVLQAHAETDLMKRAARLPAAVEALAATPMPQSHLPEDDVMCYVEPVFSLAFDVCIAGTADHEHEASPEMSMGGLNSVFIDLGGNDTYSAGEGALGSNGGLFIDVDGNDQYSANEGICYDLCNFGGTMGSVGGTFIDISGNDWYDVGPSAMGAFGGLFLELDGDDQYRFDYSQCFLRIIACVFSDSAGGVSGGTGYERRGDDTYDLFNRDEALGVGGLFMEMEGNDQYDIGYLYYGFGALSDRTQQGVFIEGHGDDVYNTTARQWQFPYEGFGHDGMFLELAGDDVYGPMYDTGFGRATMLWDPVPYPVMFLDQGGEDHYPSNIKGDGGSFIDTEGTGPDNNRWVIDGRNQTDMPTLSSGHHDVIQHRTAALGAAWNLQGDLHPAVIKLGQTVTYDVIADSVVPASLHATGGAAEVHLEVESTSLEHGAVSWGTELPGTLEVTSHQAQDVHIQFSATPPGSGFQYHVASFGTVAIDGQPPSMEFALDDGSGTGNSSLNSIYHSEDGIVTITVNDSVSGIADVYLEVGAPATTASQQIFHQDLEPDGTSTIQETTIEVPLSSLPEGLVNLQVLVVDAVGWEKAGAYAVRIDRSDPQLAINMTSQGGAGWIRNIDQLDLEVNDTVSGLKSVVWEWSGSATGAQTRSWNGLGTRTTTVAALPDTLTSGTAMLAVGVWDHAHTANSMEDSMEILVDVDAPQSILLDAGGYSPRLMQVDGFDANSGINTSWMLVEDPDGNQTLQPGTTSLDRPGSWNITYASSDRAGNVEANNTAQIIVPNQPPVASFTIEHANPFSFDTVPMTDTSSDLEGEIQAWEWDIAGQTFQTQHVTHIFESPGDYEVRLNVTDMHGATAEVSQTITIQNLVPTSGFTWSPSAPSALAEIQFTSEAEDLDGDIVSWDWDLDGTPSSLPDPTVTFPTSGPRTIRLEVMDDAGATAVHEEVISVSSVAPEINISGPDSAQSLVPVDFSQTSSDPDGTIQSVHWYVNDMPAGSGPSLQHTFMESGQHTVSATATDNDFVSTTAEHVIEISNRAPTVDFTFLPPNHKGDTVIFTADATDPDGSIGTYAWNLSGVEETGATVMHRFDTAGSHTVTLTVTDNAGQEATISKDVLVPTAAPAPNILPIAVMPSQTPLSFTHASMDVDGHITGVFWDFGDGATSTEHAPQHTYASPGTYTVILVVTDDDGLDASESTPVEVLNREPVAVLDEMDVQLGESVTFTHSSSDPDGAIALVTWTVDGVEATGDSQTHTFTSAGDHEVRLTVTDDLGATHTVVRTMQLHNEVPSIDIVGPASFYATQTATYTATATDLDGHPLQLTWQVTDGATLTGSGSSRTVASSMPGTYTLTVTATDPYGGEATAQQTIGVTRMEVSLSGVVPTEAYLGESVHLSAIEGSGGQDPNELTFDWSVDGTSIASTPTASHVFDTPGVKQLTARVTNEVGSAAQVEFSIHVINREPTISISGPESAAAGASVQFEATATDPDGDTPSIQWTVAGVPVGQSSTYVHAAGTQNVSIMAVATDAFGLTATAIVDLEVLADTPVLPGEESEADPDGNETDDEGTDPLLEGGAQDKDSPSLGVLLLASVMALMALRRRPTRKE